MSDDFKGIWHVRCSVAGGDFHSIVGSGGTRSYAQGWYDALTSLIPHPAYQLVDDKGQVREESKPVHGLGG